MSPIGPIGHIRPITHRIIHRGQAAIAAVIFLLSISLVIGSIFTGVSLRQTDSSRTLIRSYQSYAIAESGLEDIVYRYKTNKKIANPATLAAGGATAQASIVDTANGKDITITGAAGDAFRKVQASITTGVGGSFFYGVQVGNGGLKMKENTRIEGVGGSAGNISTIGSVDGDNGATITGSVTASGTVDKVTVYGDVRAPTIGKDAKICGNAYYQTINAAALNFLNNPSAPCPAPLTPGTAFPNQPPPPKAQLPIEDQTIQAWKNDAGCGQIPAVSPCLYSGDYTINSDTTLGPKTITGNLTISSNKTLTIQGTIHVQGGITINNNATIKCGSAYGRDSCVLLSDGWMDLQNNGIFSGSGTSGSYLLLLTTAACNGTSTTTPQCNTAPNNAAIDLDNNATGVILYAAYGLVHLNSNIQVTEVVAQQLTLDNNAVVQYQQGLANLEFSSGPSGSWSIQKWREVE